MSSSAPMKDCGVLCSNFSVSSAAGCQDFPQATEVHWNDVDPAATNEKSPLDIGRAELSQGKLILGVVNTYSDYCADLVALILAVGGDAQRPGRDQGGSASRGIPKYAQGEKRYGVE